MCHCSRVLIHSFPCMAPAPVNGSLPSPLCPPPRLTLPCSVFSSLHSVTDAVLTRGCVCPWHLLLMADPSLGLRRTRPRRQEMVAPPGSAHSQQQGAAPHTASSTAQGHPGTRLMTLLTVDEGLLDLASKSTWKPAVRGTAVSLLNH